MILEKILGTGKITSKLDEILNTVSEKTTGVEMQNAGFKSPWERMKHYFADIFDAQNEFAKLNQEAFDETSIDKYVNALKGLNETQAKSVINSSKLTDEQKQQVMQRYKNSVAIKVEEEATEELKEEQAGVNRETAKGNILDAQNYKGNIKQTASIVAEQEATEELKEETNALNGAVATNISLDAANTGSNVAQGASSAGTGVAVGLGTKLSGATTAIAGAFSAIPVAGQVALIAAVVIGVVAAAIKGVQKLQENWLNETKEKADEAAETIENLNSSFQNTKKSTEDIVERFAELSQGIDDISGKNVSLSSEEYEEFLNLSNQLADLFPSLSRTYDENGNAIVNLSGDVDTITSSLQQLLEVERELANQKIAEELPDVYKGNRIRNDENTAKIAEKNKELDELENQLDEVYKQIDDTEKKYNAFKNSSVISQDNKNALEKDGRIYISGKGADSYAESIKEIQKISDELNNLGIEHYYNTNTQSWNGEYDQNGEPVYEYHNYIALTEEGLFNSEYYNNNSQVQDLQTQINDLNKEISLEEKNNETTWSKTAKSINLSLYDDDQFKSMDEVIQGIVQKEVNMSGFGKYDTLEEWKKNVLADILDLYSDEEVQDAIHKLLELDLDDMPIEESEKVILEYAEKISEISGQRINPETFPTKLGLENYVGLADNYRTLRDQMSKGDNRVKFRIDELAKQYSINTQDELAALRRFWEQSYGNVEKTFELYDEYSKEKTKLPSFSDIFDADDFSEQKEELLELARAGELTPETLESTEEYQELLEKTGLSAESCKDKIYNLLVAQEKLASAHTGLDNLKSTYEEFKEYGFVTAKTLESLPEEWKSLDGYDVFSKIVGNPDSGVDAIQQAFNDIVTEYLIFTQALNSEGLMSGNEEAMRVYVANLEKMGITNAEEVVKQASESMQATETLFNNAEQEYENFLDKKESATQEFINSEDSYNTQLVNMLGTGYKTDYDNWVDSLAEKKKAYTNYLLELEKLKGGWTDKDENGNIVASGKLQAKWDKGEYFKEDELFALGYNQVQMQSIMTAQSAYLLAKKESDKFAENLKAKYTANTTSVTSKYDGTKADGNTPSDTTFDWIETKLANLNEQLEDFKETAEDSFNGWEVRDDAFGDAKDKIQELIEAQEDAKIVYQAEADKSGISADDKKLVEEGKIDKTSIEKLSDSDPRKKQIESYMEWYEKVKQCDEAIEQLNKDSLQLDRDYRSFRWEIFDYLKEQISRVTEEAEYLIGLLAEEDLFDDSGNMTEYATATFGLHISNIDTYKQLAKDDFEEIQKLQKAIDDGTADQETVDKYNELIDSHRDNINAMNDEKKAILDLVEQGYQKQLEALQKIIDKKKESLNAEKSLYDYQKSIEEKSKKVSSLQKQYDVYKNDDSEEGIAQAQRIKLELEAAQEDLEQTQYEKYLSDQEAMLDQLTSDYEEWMDARLEDENRLLTEIRDKISGEGDSILSTLQDIAGKNDTFVSDDLETSVKDGVLKSIDNHLGDLITLFKGNSTFAESLGSNIPEYASGTKRSGKGWAWTQEKGVELIRTKDGALLTPLDNSMVFNNESSRRLWEFSQNPVDYLNKLGMQNVAPQINVIAPKMPELSRTSMPSTQNNTTYMEVILPNVTNYDEFIDRMQSDKRFDKIVATSVGSKMTGGNSLNKFRY